MSGPDWLMSCVSNICISFPRLRPNAGNCVWGCRGAEGGGWQGGINRRIQTTLRATPSFIEGLSNFTAFTPASVLAALTTIGCMTTVPLGCRRHVRNHRRACPS